MNIEILTAISILENNTFIELLEEKDEVERTKLIIALTEKAKQLGVKANFEQLLKAFQKKEMQALKAKQNKRTPTETFDNITNFESLIYPDMSCGNWVADKNGVRTYSMFGECLACYHPILPIKRLINAETGTEKIVLAFLKANKWREITVDKGQIATNTKITDLANVGVSVTSETSRYLVKYLSDVENYNIDIIPEYVSTSKMGWINGEFMPYANNVIFDGNSRFEDTFSAITQSGDYEQWLELVKYYRAKGRVELKFYLAASFASVLVQPLNALPFWCNVWGGTGAGKTVAEMIAVSIWADPTNSRYISNFKTTDVATEIKSDFLNNLPLVLDDTATIKRKMGDNFSTFIYDLCSGKGKSRSNRNLGINKEKTWSNVIFSSGETPLNSENLQAGAMNRVLDLEADSTSIFEDGQAVVDIIGQNYGYAGKEFISVIKEIGFEKIEEMQKEFLQKIKAENKMEKQSVSLSILLTADKIATEHIFKDDCYIDFADIKQVLVSEESLSENERCYEFVLGEVAGNPNKFKPNNFGEYQGEMWGCYQDEYIVILSNVFEKICKNAGYSSKGFLAWAAKNNYVLSSNGKSTKVKRFGDSVCRCVFLKQKDEILTDDDLENLPFR